MVFIATNSILKIRLAWSSVMLLYQQLITVDPTDPVYNPIWRQGCYVIPFISRISGMRSLYSWSLGIKLSSDGSANQEAPFSYGVISSRPGPSLYDLLKMGNLKRFCLVV